MTSKTIAEMVKELDDKFEGLSEALDRFKLSGHISCFPSGMFSYNDVYPQIEFYSLGLKIIIMQLEIDDCITKAHDYFITKGGEL